MHAHPDRELYYVNAAVDFIFIGGASVLLFLILFALEANVRSETVIALAAGLSWVVNWPHFSATVHRLYQSRENVRRYPLTAWVIPPVIMAGVGLSLSQPETLAPFFVKLFLIWSPYHFSGQTFGITLLYARRAGIPIQGWARHAFFLFIFSAFLVPTSRFEAGIAPADFYGIKYVAFGIPAWTVEVFTACLWIGAAGVAIFAIRWSLAHRKLIPPIIVLPAIAHFIWFIPGSRLAAFQEFVPLFHSLQYLLIAWAMEMHRGFSKIRDPSGAVTRLRGTRLSLRWIALNVAGGSLLFYFLPAGTSWLGGYPLLFATGVFISGVQIHHFIVDGVIWKLRNKTVSTPLESSLADWTVSPAASR